MRVYVPATVAMVRELVASGELTPLNGTAFALTPALREFYASGTTEELEYVALLEAARASLRLLAGERTHEAESGADSAAAPGAGREAPETAGQDAPQAESGAAADPPRRAVIAADVAEVTVRSDLTEAAVRVQGAIGVDQVAAVHLDGREAETAVHAAAEVVDEADLGDVDAELAVGDAEDHELAWFAPDEVPFVLELL